jgi:hypothetical protein
MLINEVVSPKKKMIAILGWGSLLWDGGVEFNKHHDKWIHDGPTIKIEFSSISKKDDKALTLVTDNVHGSLTKVSYCMSKRSNKADAFSDLKKREQTVSDDIGVYPSKKSEKRDPVIYKIIKKWAIDNHMDYVLWTDIHSNFKEKTGKAFSKKSATDYLKSLTPKEKKEAIKYAKKAPSYVKTPMRDTIEKLSV